MIEAILIPILLFVPGAIPVYLFGTFFVGFMDALLEKTRPQDCTKRYQIYSGYKWGVRFSHWMREDVK